jgi:hypothetical protein
MNKMVQTADQQCIDFLSVNHDERGHILHSFQFNYLPPYFGSWDSAVGIGNDYGLDGRRVGVQVPVGVSFFRLHVVQASSGAHPDFYAISIGDSFPRSKVAGV